MLLVMLSVGTSHAEDVTVSKQDGKYFAELHPATRGYGPVVENANGFIESMELEVTWWWLLGQPVYYHTLIWQIRDSVRVERYAGYTIYLHRSELLSHPDLLRRFNQLKPQNVEITFDVKLSQMMIFAKVGKFGTYFDKYGEFNFRKKVKDIELMVARSGKRGENVSPGSPSYREFTGNAIKIADGMSAQDMEERLSNTFINTGAITFRNVHISRLDLPNAEIKSIYDALMRRKRGCSEYLDNPYYWTCKEKQKDKPKKSQTLKDEDGFWSNGGQAQQAKKVENNEGFSKKDNSIRDASHGTDFWKDGGKAENKATNTVLRAPDNDNFWADGGSRNSGKSDSFWQDGAQVDQEEGFEIKTVGDKQGVVASSGRMLIPFRNWEIVSYSAGMAKVLISESQTIGSCARGSDIFTYSVVASSTGYVDQIGDWVIPPEQVVQPSNSAYTPLVLTSTRAGATYEEKERAKARRERRREKERREFSSCKLDIKTSRQQIYRSYQAKGFVVKS